MKTAMIRVLIPAAIVLLGAAGYGIGQTIDIQKGQTLTLPVDISASSGGADGASGVPRLSLTSVGTSPATFYTISSNSFISIGNPPPPPPTGSVFHQVVDKYFDRDGNVLGIQSATHAVNGDCHGGLRRQEELIAQDDGKGNVIFAQIRLPSEPAEGVRQVTQADKIKVIMAAKSSPAQPDPATVSNDTSTLALR